MTRSGRFVVLVAVALSSAVFAETPGAFERPVDWTAPPFWTPTTPTTPAADRTAQGREGLAIPPGIALPLVAVSPCRLVDTRGNGAPLTGGFLPPATVRTYSVAGWCGIPGTARALSLNATVVNPTGPGFLVLYPEGGAFPPVSTLNYLGHDVIVNAAVVPISATGGLSMALGVSGGDVLLDVNGYYAPQTVVNTLNSLSGDVTLAAGANVTLTPAGNTVTIAAAAAPSSLPPSGPAGGSLSGTYPNPGLAASSVGATALADSTAVRSLNGLKDNVTLTAGNNVTITPAGNTLTIATPIAPNAHAVQTVAQTFATNTFVIVNLDTMSFSSQAVLAGNAITVTKTGVYQVNGEIIWTSNGAGIRFLSVNRQDGTELAAATAPATPAVIESILTVPTLTRLNAGDSVHLLAAHTAGANLATSPFNGRAAALSVVWVAP